MNEFVAKKLGEVLAFARIGLEMGDRGGAALKQAYGDQYDEFITVLKKQQQYIEGLNERAVLDKADATTAKLRTMMETYIGDEWDNPTELLEWSGFYLGSATVHWNLVVGAAEALAQTEVLDLAKEGFELNHNLLHLAQAKIKAVAAQKVQTQN